MFHIFAQNFVDGKFIINHVKGIGHYVIVEAGAPDLLAYKCEQIGLNTTGHLVGDDSDPRWDETFPTFSNAIEAIDYCEEDYEDNEDSYHDYLVGYIHYADGGKFMFVFEGE